MSPIKVRKATLMDLDAITGIYNDAILNTVATFDTVPKSDEEQEKWFLDHSGRYPILVAEKNGVIGGWASITKWSDRCAYSDTAELSLYVHKDFRGRGIGKELMKATVKAAEKGNIHVLLARIAEGNEISIHLHESVGFELVGVMKEVGFKFNKRLDIYLMQRLFKTHFDPN